MRYWLLLPLFQQDHHLALNRSMCCLDNIKESPCPCYRLGWIDELAERRESNEAELYLNRVNDCLKPVYS